MFGANKTATATGGTLQLRALDWDVDGMAHTHMHFVYVIEKANTFIHAIGTYLNVKEHYRLVPIFSCRILSRLRMLI